jgi:hypothetical protein
MELGRVGRARIAGLAAALAVSMVGMLADVAAAAKPIKIGFSMALTGAYAGNGKGSDLAQFEQPGTQVILFHRPTSPEPRISAT